MCINDFTYPVENTHKLSLGSEGEGEWGRLPNYWKIMSEHFRWIELEMLLQKYCMLEFPTWNGQRNN